MNLKKMDYIFGGIISLAFIIEFVMNHTIEIELLMIFALLIMVSSNNNEIRDLQKKIEGEN